MKNNKKGFTLVELVIVVAVMAVLVAVAIPTVGSIVGTAEDAVYDSNCRTIESMIKLAQAEAANKAEASADGSSVAGTMTASTIKTCLENAKLGIESATFYYHSSTGAVNSTATAASGETVVTITYAADGSVTTA